MEGPGVCDVTALIASECIVVGELVPAEMRAVRDLVDERLRESQGGLVESEIAAAEAVLFKSIEREAPVKDEGWTHGPNVVEHQSMVDALERLLPVLARSFKDA